MNVPDFPPNWPEGCPPAEATDANGLVFRIVRSSPPTVEDFKTYHELGLAPQAPPCSRRAISVFNTRLNACHRLKLTPRLGTQVAEGTLKPEHGKARLNQPTDEERSAVLQALLQLAPPTTGAISEIEVSGRWMTAGTARLTRGARKRVRSEMRRSQYERVVRQEGRIGEMDRDNLSLTLRQTEDGADLKGYFQEDLLDDVLERFAEGGLVVVAGIERAGRLYIAAIGAAEHAADPIGITLTERHRTGTGERGTRK